MDHIRRLLNSLKKSERRYLDVRFKHSATGKHDRGYQLLRGFLDHPEKNDAQLANKLGFTSSAFSTRKNDVLNRVLYALADFDSDRHKKMQLLKEVAVIRLLGDRGHYLLALKKLRKAQATAVNLDLFDVQLLLTTEERGIFYRIYPKQEWIGARENLSDLLRKSTNGILNKHFYLERVMRINEINSGATARRTEEVARQAEQLLDDPMLQDEQNAQSPTALYNYLTVHRLAAELTGDQDAELHFSKRLAELVLNKESGPGKGLKARVMTLALYMDSHAHLGDPEDPFYMVCHQELDNIRRSKKRKDRQNMYYLLVSHGSDVVIAIRAKQYKRALNTTEKAIEDINAHPEMVRGLSRNNLFFLFAAAYLLNGKWDKTLDLLHPVLTEEKQTDRLDFFHLCLLLEIIVHLEMDHHRFVDSRIESLSTYFRKLKAPHRFERIFITYLRKINRTAKIQRMPLWRQLAADLETIRTDKHEKVMFLTVDLLEHWLKPKLQDIPQ